MLPVRPLPSGPRTDTGEEEEEEREVVRIVHVEMRRRARRAMNVVRLRDGRGKGMDSGFSLDFEVRRVSEKGENL